MITPQTDVYLLKVPLEIDSTNQLTFNNAEAQFNYFNSLPKLAFDNFTYQRKDGVLRLPVLVDNIMEYNYVMYRNEAYSSKWFYAYITDLEYLSDGVTAVAIKTDVWQTWQFNLNYKPVFVEREHVNDDRFGLHTIPENLETGEYVRDINGVDFSFNDEYWLAFQVTELISNMDDGGGTGGRIYNGIYNGLTIVLLDNYITANNLVSAYDDAGKHEAIISCFYVPKALEPSPYVNSGVVLHDVTSTIYFPRTRNTAVRLANLTIDKPTNIDGYVPKNNKLFTQQFCYLQASNNSGADTIYSFEDFRVNGTSQTQASFRVEGVISQGCNIKLYPESFYKSPSNGTPGYTMGGYNYGLSAGKLPICSWNSDYYTNWLTQNAVNIGTSSVSGIINTGLNLATGNVVGAGVSLFNTIASNVTKTYEASLVPNQAKGNTNCGDINFALDKNISIHVMTIRREYAIICDNFFSQFGYKVNRVKVPNITGRRNWNYVKTIGCYIEANIPQDDLQEIKSMFDRGITFWHNPTTFADYNQNNDII